MKKLALRLMIVVWLLSGTMFAQADRQQEPRVTAVEATQRAADFLQAVGRDTTGDRRATPASEPHIDAWEVTIGDSSVEVDGVTGSILYAVDSSALRSKAERGTVHIAASVANNRAMDYVRAAGVSISDVEVASSEPTNLTSDPGMTLWRITFRRLHGGIAFYADAVRVALDPVTGGFISFGNTFYSPLPDSADVLVRKEDSERIARDYLAGLGLEAGGMTSIELKIVQPDDYWEYLDSVRQEKPPHVSRVAWVVGLDAPWEKTEAWIDTESGYVLGGVKSRSVAKGKVSQAPVVSVADTILLRKPDQSGKSRRIAVSSATGKSITKAMSSLSRAPYSDCKASVTLKLEGKDRSYTYAYSASSRQLVLLEKSYAGKDTKGRVAWKTSAEFDRLMKKTMSSL